MLMTKRNRITGLIDRLSLIPRSTTGLITVGATTLTVFFLLGYVIWIRHETGKYFSRFLRSYPCNKPLMVLWLVGAATSLGALLVAAAVPQPLSRAIFIVDEIIVIGIVLGVALASGVRDIVETRAIHAS